MDQKNSRDSRPHPAESKDGSTKVAVVTGASRGLGKEIAFTLSRAGYHIAVNYYLSKKEADEIVRSMSFPSMAVKADVGNLREVEQMAREVYKRWGRVDLLINNAGIARDGLVIRYEESDWDEVILAQEEWINRMCIGVIIVAALYFVPPVLTILFLG